MQIYKDPTDEVSPFFAGESVWISFSVFLSAISFFLTRGSSNFS